MTSDRSGEQPPTLAERLAKAPLLSDSGLHLEYGGLTIEPDAEALTLSGELVLRRDQESLRRAEAVLQVLQAFVAEVRADARELPAKAEESITPPTTIGDPFGR